MGLQEYLSSVETVELSRRQLLTSTGALAVGFGGGIVFNGDSMFPPSELPPFIAKQGQLRWELRPFSYKDWTISEFYGYTSSGGQSAEFPVDMSNTEDASRVFLFSGPVDDSVVFHHGSAEATSGGTAFFKFSGLSRSKGEWAVRDDPMGVDDDFEKWEGGNAKVKWQWGAHETDGGAYWGVLDDSEVTVKITPKTLRGVEEWLLLSNTSAGPKHIPLATDKPLIITDAKRPVRTVAMDIMPDSSKNVFDPYEKRRITVALESGKEVDPAKLDPGNQSVYFGSKSTLASGNGAQPQKYFQKNGTLFLEFNIKSANFTLDSEYGYLVTKTSGGAWVRGRDGVNPGGVNSSSSGSLNLYGYNVDPSGDDSQNLTDEWVEFRNTGDQSLDLTGWSVQDADNNRYGFPDGFSLAPDETVMLHTGHGTDTPHHLYWGKGSPVWQNGGDTIVVKDDTGNTVLYQAYPQR